MKQFVRRVAWFLSLQGLLIALILSPYDGSREMNYLAATCDKQSRLQRSRAPRIILVGGSNLAFGIDSTRLGQAFGREVVNMGLVAGLGLDFMLNEVEPALQPGDIVVLSLEYDRFSGGFNPLNLQQIIQYRPASLRYLELRQWNRVLLRGGPAILGGIMRRALHFDDATSTAEIPASPVYVRSGFNAQGDLIAHYGQPGSFVWSPSAGPETLHPDWLPTAAVQKHLRRFAEKCAKEGAVFTFSCPPQPPEILNTERKTVAAILQVLQTVPGLKILDSPDDQAYALPLFFDTGYHLMREGTSQRTAKLIGSLRRIESER